MSESPTPRPRARLTPWLAAIGVLAVAVVAFGAVQVFDDDGGSATDSPTSGPTSARTTSPQLTLTESVPLTNPGGPEPPAGDPGALEADGRDLYPSLGGSLESFAGEQVEGTAVPVVAVNGESSLWVGRPGNQRLLVVLNLKGEPFPRLQVGDRVDLIGMIQPNQGEYDVTDARSKALLARQGHHAFVSVFDLER
jgi:hypothetical protein